MKNVKDLIRRKATRIIQKEVKKAVKPAISHILTGLETIGILASCYGSFKSIAIAPEPSKMTVFIVNNYHFR